MQLTYAPHIVQDADGAIYKCSCCGGRLTLGPVIMAKEFAAKLRRFLSGHADCPARQAFLAAQRDKVRQLRPVKPRASRVATPRLRRFKSLQELLADTVKQIAPEAEDGRVRLGLLTERYNARAAEHGWQPIKASQVAARLRRWRLRISAVEYPVNGGRGKCLLVGNAEFRRFAGMEG